MPYAYATSKSFWPIFVLEPEKNLGSVGTSTRLKQHKNRNFERPSQKFEIQLLIKTLE